jgi:hypothetical protein
MTRTWLSIRVELVEGRGERFWPRPGRIFAAARSHTFAQLADAIDDAFARWDRAHLHEFELADGTRLTTPYGDDDEFGPSLDDRRTRLSRLDPIEALGIVPRAPLSFCGWGAIPDQYGRRWDEDDGESPLPANPGVSDLPPLRRRWGKRT